MWDIEEEEEKDENGQLVLTNKFLREMVKKDPRKYFRTPHLNEKLFLHYKGFGYIRNLEQFTDLKCLYIEGNGLRSLKGLEQNIELKSLYAQENCIEEIEGLETLKELRVLNLNENMIRKVTGLAGIELLDTLYLKNNRLGQDKCGDVETLKGLLERPTITCLDIQGNYLRDPEIMEEVIYKMPNLRVLYLMNNEVVKKIPHYRKTVIAKIPELRYLDDRPVFEEDRRKAEAFARGGIEAEREEMRKIRQEKDDKHWANHEAFMEMMRKAKKEKQMADEARDLNQEQPVTKEAKKETMKEMMARAKREKEMAQNGE